MMSRKKYVGGDVLGRGLGQGVRFAAKKLLQRAVPCVRRFEVWGKTM